MIIVARRKSEKKVRQIVAKILICLCWADWYRDTKGRYVVRYDGTREDWARLVERWAEEDGDFSVRWGCGFLRP